MIKTCHGLYRYSSFLVMVSFLFVLVWLPKPISAKTEPQKIQIMSGGDEPGSLEGNPAASLAKKKKFPWLLTFLAAAAAGAAVYFFVLKDKGFGLNETFDTGASADWVPRTPALWTVADGVYRCFNSLVSYREYNYYNHFFSTDNATLTVRVRQTMGNYNQSQMFIFTTGTNMMAINGYMFEIFTYQQSPGKWSVGGLNNYNFVTGGSSGYTSGTGIQSSYSILTSPSWNEVRISRSDNLYTFFCNSAVLGVFDMSGSPHDPGYICLGLYSTGDPSRVEYDLISYLPD